MFVISHINSGELKSTAIRETADEAVDLGYEWYGLYHNESNVGDYIAIDQQVKGMNENARFAEIRMDGERVKVELFLEFDENNKKRKPVFSKRMSQISKQVIIFFMELAYLQLTEYFKAKYQNNNKGEKLWDK